MLAATAGGIVLGAEARQRAPQRKMIRDALLRLIRAIVAPLFFGVLVRAVAVSMDPTGQGRVGVKASSCSRGRRLSPACSDEWRRRARPGDRLALPQMLEKMEKFGVPPRILGSLAPLSISLNLCGSTLILGLAMVFVAQAARVPLSLEQQVLILLTLKLTSKGVAGIPRANVVVLRSLLRSLGLPLEGRGLLLGADAPLDPNRTGVNVLGHCVAPAVVAPWEGVRFFRGLEPAGEVKRGARRPWPSQLGRW